MMQDGSIDARNELPDDDDGLLDALRRLCRRADPVPLNVMAAARAAKEWRRLDSELARLSYDSVLDEPLAGVRAAGSARQLTFEGAGLTVELEVASDRGGFTGQVVPPQAARIDVRHSQGSFSVTADELGHFRAGSLPTGPLSLRCLPDSPAPGESRPTETEWIVM